MKTFPMKSNNMNRLLSHTIALVLMTVSTTTIAQHKRDSLQNQTVTVVKSYTPTVRDADKISVNPPPDPEADFTKIPQTYTPLDIEAVSTYMAEKGKLVRPSVKTTRLDNIPGYLELGVGNEKAFRLKTFYDHNLQNGLNAGGSLSFFSLGNTRYDSLRLNAFSDFNVEIFARKKTDVSRWSVKAGYEANRSAYRDTLTPLQVLKTPFTNHCIGLQTEGTFYENFFRSVEVRYRYLSAYTGYEHSVKLGSGLLFPLAGFDIETKLSAALSNGNAGTGYSNWQAGIQPAFRYERERFLFKLGFKLFYQNRTDINDAVLFYPDVAVEYNMIPEMLTLYLRYEGGIKTRSYNELLNDNRYIAPVKALKPTSTPYHFKGGFKGAIGTRMNFNLSLGMVQEKNRPLLILTNRPEGLTLTPVYDDLDYFYFKTHLSYVANEHFETKLKFDYYQYTPQTQPKAWNSEDYKVSWLLRFNIGKFDGRSNLYYIGPRYDLWNGNTVKTGETVDVNLAMGYKLLQGLYIYAEANNLLNRRDWLYYQYPVHGLHILAGVVYSFK